MYGRYVKKPEAALASMLCFRTADLSRTTGVPARGSVSTLRIQVIGVCAMPHSMTFPPIAIYMNIIYKCCDFDWYW